MNAPACSTSIQKSMVKTRLEYSRHLWPHQHFLSRDHLPIPISRPITACGDYTFPKTSNLSPVLFRASYALISSPAPTPQPPPSPSPSPQLRHPTPPLTPTIFTFRSRHPAYHPLSLPRPTYTYRATCQGTRMLASTDLATAGRPRW